MKNMTKKEIALVIVTIALVAFEGISLVNLFKNGTPMHWSQFQIAFSALVVSFCAIDKEKKAEKAMEAKAE